MPVRLVSGACQAGIGCLSGWYRVPVRLVSGACQAGIGCLSGWYRVPVRLVSGACQAGVGCLSGWYRVPVRLVSGACQAGIGCLSGWYRVSVRLVSGVCQANTRPILYTVSQLRDQPWIGAASRLHSRRELGDPPSKHEIADPAHGAGLGRSSIGPCDGQYHGQRRPKYAATASHVSI